MLLAIYAGSQVASTYFMGATMDKTQRTIMMVLPLVFLTVVSRFPTGLVLYWMTTNLWTVGQGLITRRLDAEAGLGGARAPAGPEAELAHAAAATPRPHGGQRHGRGSRPKPRPSRPAPRQAKKGGARR